MRVLSPWVPELATLELLVAVAETGSLGRAAARAGTSQQAVSARLRRAERAMGVTLLQRSPRGATLSREGVLLVAWAREVLAAAQVLEAGVAALRVQRDARVRIAASLTVAEYLLPQWLVQLAGEHPDTAVSLEAVNSADVAERVLSGAADLGFVEGPHLPDGLQERVVAHDRLQVVVTPGHPWARRRRGISAAELASTRLVQREAASGTRQSLEAALRTALDADPRTDSRTDSQPAAGTGLAPALLELASTSAVRAAVLGGAGPAVLSGFAVAEEVRAGRLVQVPVLGVDLRRLLRAVWPTGTTPTGPARDLLAIVARTG